MNAPDPPESGASRRNAIPLGLVSLCFFLSGMAGLIYQMVWMRYLSALFGTSELAIVAVLVAYMGGLATVAWVVSKHLHRLRRPMGGSPRPSPTSVIGVGLNLSVAALGWSIASGSRTRGFEIDCSEADPV